MILDNVNPPMGDVGAGPGATVSIARETAEVKVKVKAVRAAGWHQALAGLTPKNGAVGDQRANYPFDFHGRTLRLALAMRGGVSLAVWIGGAVAELDLVRALRVYRMEDGTVTALLAWDGEKDPSAVLEERVKHYARLLDTRGYHRVEMDVLAGASAGGLNSVLFAGAQSLGSSTDGVLDVWLESGSVAALLRPAKPGEARSALRGNEYFYGSVYAALDRFQRPAGEHPGLRADYVSVDLSATVIDAKESAERSHPRRASRIPLRHGGRGSAERATAEALGHGVHEGRAGAPSACGAEHVLLPRSLRTRVDLVTHGLRGPAPCPG